jgi:hypothetical protein
MSKNWYEQFTKFFFKYFLVGLALILISVVYKNGIEVFVHDPFWKEVFSYLISIIDIIGPSLLVASLFTFSIESRSFIDYIKDIIENVIIKKEFLGKLSLIDKREALQRILYPNKEHFNLFGNIKNYFDETIEKNLTLFEYNFKSHLQINITAKNDNEGFYLYECFSYRIYKGEKGFQPVRFGFENTESKLVSCEYATSKGNIIRLKETDFCIDDQIEESGSKWCLYSYNIPSEIEGDYITLYSKTIEKGHDHWQLFSYKTILPSEGLNLILDCSNDITIKEFMIFDNDKNYNCQLSNDKKRLEICTTQWLSPGVGLNILVSKN